MFSLFPGQFAPIGFVEVSLDAITAVELSASFPDSTSGVPKYALIQAITNNVLWRDDGDPPTTTVGMTMAKDLTPQGFLGDLNTVQFIAATGTAKLRVSFYA